MKWENLGPVFSPAGRVDWAAHSALQPTPLVLDDRIRVYAGFRDENGVGRVGYADLDRADPTRVIGWSRRPVLDIGQTGCFDENGVVSCAVVPHDGALRLYYAGYQPAVKVRFMVFGGLAVSRDGGESFERTAGVPVTDRTDDARCFRVIHSIIRDGEVWRTWYGAGSTFRDPGDGRSLPEYNVRYMESPDGTRFPPSGEVALDTQGPEYRVGRPYVVRDGDGWRMHYGYSTAQSAYRLGFATSQDGRRWRRRDAELDLPTAGWDSDMSAYPAVVTVESRTWMFYNGNEYGREGFGLALLQGG
jgi:predicted GH43/DUF377 family glycosyl hydrolase